MRTPARILARGALWAVLGLGAGLLALIAVPLAFDHRPLTVLSGSMEPTLDTGDGVVVTFRDPHGRLITHRVRAVRERRSGFEFVTKGDANNASERWKIAE